MNISFVYILHNKGCGFSHPPHLWSKTTLLHFFQGPFSKIKSTNSRRKYYILYNNYKPGDPASNQRMVRIFVSSLCLKLYLSVNLLYHEFIDTCFIPGPMILVAGTLPPSYLSADVWEVVVKFSQTVSQDLALFDQVSLLNIDLFIVIFM